MKELISSGECAIPHFVKRQGNERKKESEFARFDDSFEGVILHSECSEKPLRLTNAHLVKMADGSFREAQTLVIGDVMLGFNGQSCPVQATERETGEKKQHL